MSFTEELDQTAEWSPESLSTFQRDIPVEWIETALETTGTASIRRRRLPAEQVVWLVLGIGLYRDRSIRDICDKLDLAMPDSQGRPVVATSALAQARERLGAEPMRYLFLSSAEAWSRQERQNDFHGLKLLSVDGTVFETPDSAENGERFGFIESRKGYTSAFPSVRLTALMSLRTHLVWEAAFGPCTQGEINYARELVSAAPAHSLTLFDRCYFSAELLLSWQQAQPESHWLTPLKRKMRYRVVESFSEHDCLVEMPISPQSRAQYPHLPATWRARMLRFANPKGEITGFLTSLTDLQRYPAADLLGIYWERWEIEQGYGELKRRQLRSELLLRSQKPEGIRQELWGILLAYNLVRLEISRIAEEAGIAPLRISFLMALRYIQDEFLWCAVASPGTVPKKLRALRANVKAFILPERKRPSVQRAVRKSRTRYPISEKHPRMTRGLK